jgi:hypothetical protein
MHADDFAGSGVQFTSENFSIKGYQDHLLWLQIGDMAHGGQQHDPFTSFRYTNTEVAMAAMREYTSFAQTLTGSYSQFTQFAVS